MGDDSSFAKIVITRIQCVSYQRTCAPGDTQKKRDDATASSVNILVWDIDNLASKTTLADLVDSYCGKRTVSVLMGARLKSQKTPTKTVLHKFLSAPLTVIALSEATQA